MSCSANNTETTRAYQRAPDSSMCVRYALQRIPVIVRPVCSEIDYLSKSVKLVREGVRKSGPGPYFSYNPRYRRQSSRLT